RATARRWLQARVRLSAPSSLALVGRSLATPLRAMTRRMTSPRMVRASLRETLALTLTKSTCLKTTRMMARTPTTARRRAPFAVARRHTTYARLAQSASSAAMSPTTATMKTLDHRLGPAKRLSLAATLPPTLPAKMRTKMLTRAMAQAQTMPMKKMKMRRMTTTRMTF
ncbi:hypothetical protein GGH95_002010, partial [Coemansia sp. RSA 1836]